MNKLEKAAILGLLLTLIFSSMVAFAQDCNAIRSDVLRLHILANSNSEEDQALKLKVRDRVLTAANGIFYNAQNKDQAIKNAKENIQVIQAAAEDEIQKNGYSYPVSIQICNMYFDVRQYGNLTMPAGMYDAVRITIGEGAGKNWWCIMFPPLCLPAAEGNTQLNDVMDGEQSDIVEQAPEYTVKFALLDFFDMIKNGILSLFGASDAS